MIIPRGYSPKSSSFNNTAVALSSLNNNKNTTLTNKYMYNPFHNYKQNGIVGINGTSS